MHQSGDLHIESLIKVQDRDHHKLHKTNNAFDLNVSNSSNLTATQNQAMVCIGIEMTGQIAQLLTSTGFMPL